MSKIPNKLLSHANSNIEMTELEKNIIIDNAATAYEKFMDALQIDWRNDPNSTGTPRRVAKSFVNELAKGCYTTPPAITSFPSNGYDGMVFQSNIPVKSLCSHHHLSFTGVCHLAYLPGEKVCGLSKLNRIVEFYARRFQIQEDLTNQIAAAVDKVCEGNRGVACVVECSHSCCVTRGVNSKDCVMKTSKLTGEFMNDPATRAEFYHFIKP